MKRGERKQVNWKETSHFAGSLKDGNKDQMSKQISLQCCSNKSELFLAEMSILEKQAAHMQ
jgi:hypothetical protein